jgi:PilX N-terminal
MKKNTEKKIISRKNEQGMALIMSMMALTLLTGIGLATVFNSSGDMAMSGGFRRNEQAFFAADAGIGLAREALRVELNKAVLARAAAAISSSNITYGYGTTTLDQDKLRKILGRNADGTADPDLLGTALSTSPINKVIADINDRGSSLGSGVGFQMAASDISLTLYYPTCPGTDCPEGAVMTQAGSPVGQVFPKNYYEAKYRYRITSKGNYSGGGNATFGATATAKEDGVVTVRLRPQIGVTSSTSSSISRSFSSYGIFYARNGLTDPSYYSYFGNASGPVHMNDWYRFHKNFANTFKDQVTQGGSSTGTTPAKYQYNGGSGTADYTVNNTNRTGLNFNSSFTSTGALPIPQNVYTQEAAVLNGSGASTTAPTQAQLTATLRKPNNTLATASGTSVATGVYLPSTDGTNLTGSGIYVKGNADDVRLSIDNGKQVYEVIQGTVATKITVDITNNTTGTGTTSIQTGTVATAAGAATYSGSPLVYTGTPLDKTDPSNIKTGTLLYVDGTISSLHGPTKTGSGSTAITAAAIAANTRLTVTSTQDISVTGDLKYTNQTVNNDGTPITANASAVNTLGIYTSTGKIILDPEAAWTSGQNMDLSIDAALVAFNEPALTDASTSNDYTGGRGDCVRCITNGFDKTKATLYHRGSQVYSIDLLWTKGFGSNGSKPIYQVFDPRFGGGAVAPPWFPVTSLATAVTTATTYTLSFYTSNVSAESNTWQRVNS